MAEVSIQPGDTSSKASVLNHYANNTIKTDSNNTITPAMSAATAAATTITAMAPVSTTILLPV